MLSLLLPPELLEPITRLLLAPALRNPQLSPDEANAIIAYLETLTEE